IGWCLTLRVPLECPVLFPVPVVGLAVGFAERLEPSGLGVVCGCLALGVPLPCLARFAVPGLRPAVAFTERREPSGLGFVRRLLPVQVLKPRLAAGISGLGSVPAGRDRGAGSGCPAAGRWLCVRAGARFRVPVCAGHDLVCYPASDSHVLLLFPFSWPAPFVLREWPDPALRSAGFLLSPGGCPRGVRITAAGGGVDLRAVGGLAGAGRV